MTDDELATYIGVATAKDRAGILAAITPSQRALYEDMARIEREAELWLAGAGPKPTGVIICERRKR